MTHVDGRMLSRHHLRETADVVVVGSGPAGATVARELARSGAKVAIVEAGPWVQPKDYPLSAFGSMASLYRSMGASVAIGPAPMPYLQGKMVGGSSPINGAICWRLPRDIYDGWVRADPALEGALPWDDIEHITDTIEDDLGVAPTDAAIAGPKNLLMAKGANVLGLEHRPIRRNVRGCIGLGRCIQGCPKGYKQSMDQTLLVEAMDHGATIYSSTSVRRVNIRRGRALGVVARTQSGGEVEIHARHAVVLAASAVQTPVLLLESGVGHGPVGKNFQCHPGVSLAGRFPEPIRMWEGATQGHEVIGLRHEGIKFEALGFGLSVLAARLAGVGEQLAVGIADMEHWLDWGAAIKAEAQGRVRSVLGHPVVSFQPTVEDVRRFRRGLRVLGDMMFAAGAERVLPAVKGFDAVVENPAVLARFEHDGPQHPSAFQAAITHMFGTCQMGSDPETSVVRPDFRHHTVGHLYIADSSVFPTNIGVNPQIPIMTLATLCGRAILAQKPQ